MESVTSISIQQCERNIKFDRKWVRWQMFWVVFNILFTVFDAKVLMDNHSIFCAMAFGAMIVTSLWSFVFFIECWSELRSEKLKHRFLTELHETELSSFERNRYLNSAQHYEQLIKNLKREKNDKGI